MHALPEGAQEVQGDPAKGSILARRQAIQRRLHAAVVPCAITVHTQGDVAIGKTQGRDEECAHEGSHVVQEGLCPVLASPRMSKPRRPRVGVGDLVDVAPTPSVYVSSGDRGSEQEEGQGAAPQPASVPKPRSSRPPRASEGGSVVVAAASSIMSPSPTQVASGGTITVKAGALPVFGSYDLRGAGGGGDKATKRVGFGDSVEVAPQGGAHSAAGAEDVAYRVFTPIVDAKVCRCICLWL